MTSSEPKPSLDDHEKRLKSLEHWNRRFFGPTTTGFLIAFGVFAFLLYAQAFDSRADSLRSCERANQQRISELEQRQFLVDVNLQRVAATTGDEQAANQLAVDRYRANRDDLIAAQQDVAIAPGENSEEGVTVRCGEAFPKPWPFGYFDG